MADFTKYAWEEVFRYYDFSRDDGRDGLSDDETLSSVTVTCEDENGSDCSATMISSAAPVSGECKATYKLLGGTSGSSYTVIVRGVTSAGQKMEGRATIDVI